MSENLMSFGEGVELDFDPYAPVYASEPHMFEYIAPRQICVVKHQNGTECGKARWEHA